MSANNQWEKFQKIFKSELGYIQKRRMNISGNPQPDIDNQDKIKNQLFGIALSGGGIRSSTFNMGILNFLNEKKILRLADYISSVSGGGFIHSYIQAKLNSTNNFNELFNKNSQEPLADDNGKLKSNCDYLIPGHNFLSKVTSYIRMYGAVISSFIMNLLWLFIIILFLLLILKFITVKAFLLLNINEIYIYLAGLFSLFLFYHYFFFVLRNKKVWSSNLLNYSEGFIILFIAIILGSKFINGIQTEGLIKYIFNLGFLYPDTVKLYKPDFIINGVALFILFLIFGFFANPNILSLHRYYRDRIAQAFIKPFIKKSPNIKLYELISDKSINPYPLINTCLNLTDRRDNNMPGIESSDYFLLSPKFCGSSFTEYLSTEKEYSSVTLATAAAISGSAVSTLMGNKTNRFISIFLYLFNAVLGYWIKNPNWRDINPFKKFNFKNDIFIKYFTFWPYYLWNSMLGKANQKRGRVNISDGGHIENLAVFELLRRRCKLIIAVDASADSKYNFSDLENLVKRAREKLGLSIEFKVTPEEIIKPVPSYGYSIEHYSKAVIKCLPNTPDCDESYEGILIYIKSSLKAPLSWEIDGGTSNENEAKGFNYKINHPSFPHESTIDQFFDPEQWDAYYFLGRQIAGDIFNIIPDSLEEFIGYCSNRI